MKSLKTHLNVFLISDASKKIFTTCLIHQDLNAGVIQLFVLY